MKISLLTAFAFVPLALNAGIIFDNGGPNSLDGHEMGDTIQAEDFVVSFTSDLTAIRYWTLEAPGAYLGSLTWAIYSDSSGQPGSTVASGNTSSVTTTDLGPVSGLGLPLNLFRNDFFITVNGL